MTPCGAASHLRSAKVTDGWRKASIRDGPDERPRRDDTSRGENVGRIEEHGGTMDRLWPGSRRTVSLGRAAVHRHDRASPHHRTRSSKRCHGAANAERRLCDVCLSYRSHSSRSLSASLGASPPASLLKYAYTGIPC